MAHRKLTAEKLERKHEIIRLFREAKKNKPSTSMEIADWAIQNDLWRPHPKDLRKLLAEEISRAMSEEFITDPQGRRVRAKHAARDGQQFLWVDIRDKNPSAGKLKIISFQTRRQQVVGDLKQLKTDVDSFNQNFNYTNEEPFQLVLDLTDDVTEAEIAAKNAA
jgi:hypothetical protein